MLTFEDFAAGRVFPLGERTVGRDEIVAFARDWDPQPMHLDEAAGRASLLGTLAASGWHTAALVTRLLVDEVLSRSTAVGSPGIESLRWLRPVAPDTTLSATLTVLAARPSTSRPAIGLVRGRIDVADEQDRPVMTMTGTMMFARRQAS